jgi:hypothetical protein
MSPEQARGDAIDARSDLFGLGSVIYAMCTGRPPFRADTSFGVLRRITDTEPRPIGEVNGDLPAWITPLVNRLLAKDPANRFASAGEVATVMAQCLAHVEQPSTEPLPELCRVGPAQRRPTVLVALAAIAIGLVAAGLIWMFGLGPAVPSYGVPGHGVPGHGVPGFGHRPNPAEQQLTSPLNSEATPLSDSDLDWNASASEVEALSSEVDSLDKRAGLLWDHQLVPAPPLNETNPELIP